MKISEDERRRRAELMRKEALVLSQVSMKFGERVRHYRALRGITQFELAKISGYSAPSLIRIESGRSLAISLRHFLRLCRALGVDPSTMVRGLRL